MELVNELPRGGDNLMPIKHPLPTPSSIHSPLLTCVLVITIWSCPYKISFWGKCFVRIFVLWLAARTDDLCHFDIFNNHRENSDVLSLTWCLAHILDYCCLRIVGLEQEVGIKLSLPQSTERKYMCGLLRNIIKVEGDDICLGRRIYESGELYTGVCEM